MCLWHKQTVYSMKTAMQSRNATATLPDWSLWDKIPSVALLWKFSVGVDDMHYSAPSCRWPSRGGQDARRMWGQREKLRDQSLKSGSWVSWEAGTKNNTWLKYLPSNKQQSAANCNTVFTKTGDWAEASGIARFRICAVFPIRRLVVVFPISLFLLFMLM